MEKPSNEEREALRHNMASMKTPTENLQAGFRNCGLVINQGPVSLLPAA